MVGRSDIEAMDRPTMLYMIYGEYTTDEPLCIRQPNIFEMMPFFTRRLIYHITNLVARRTLQGLRKCISSWV